MENKPELTLDDLCLTEEELKRLDDRVAQLEEERKRLLEEAKHPSTVERLKHRRR